MKTISQGRMFGVVFEIDDGILRALRKTPEILQKANEAAAIAWHTQMLPGHFEASAHDIYGYAQRAKNYLITRRKQGKPDLVLTGSMQREMTHNRQITTTASGVKLRLWAHVLNLVPRMGENSQDLYVTHQIKGHRRSFPNMKREVKVVIPAEQEALAKIARDYAMSQYRPGQSSMLHPAA